MKKFNSSLILSIIKSNILLSKTKNKIFVYTKILQEIKQFIYLIKYCIKNEINIYIVCDMKQYKYLFDKFLDSKIFSIITSSTALKISKKSFFILIGDNFIFQQVFTKLTYNNNIVFFIGNNNIYTFKNYKMTLYLDTFHKILFIISLLKKL